MPTPGQKTPELKLETVAHGTFDLSDPGTENGTLLVFYRGLHCPVCAGQLKELEAAAEDFAARGLRIVAATADPADRATEMARKTGLDKVAIAHSLSLQAARDDWGLYISAAREGSSEPALFHEPGLFFVNADRELQFGSVQTMPFARPKAADVLAAITFMQDKGYPPRGTYTGDLGAKAA
ncbi:redoxin [Maritimibacter sp. 55A14]|uniref:redoxin domain-containing protein n=1 Tax=Maritimibacter sp. 55A14 TaxID=2174844 RepID=UPI000D608FB9|nr:redoxin domain-containing protein [Maritimibacter sp. 55A14]PWE33642.1 redoxin [Maritimibacter sp. 55A14]